MGLMAPDEIRAKGLEAPFFLSERIFNHLYQIQSNIDAVAETSDEEVNYEVQFKAASSLPDIRDLVLDGLRTKLSKTLAIDKANIEGDKPMHTLGVDSLAALEIRTWFRRAIGADVAVFEILGNTSILTLCLAAAGKSSFVPAAKKEGQ